MSAFEEKYRKRNPAEATQAAPAMDVLKAAAKEEYKAFNANAHPELQLWVRVSAANACSDVALPFGYCNHMITDGSGFVISMHFNTPIISITIHGRNLVDLWRKLLKHEVEWIMEFDARKWEAPGDAEPCITGIEIHRAERKNPDGMLPGENREPEKTTAH
jgi:hypothetical protein